MQYMFKVKQLKSRAHIWNGKDTVCRMWSTGSFRKHKYQIQTDLGGRQICHQCQMVSQRILRERGVEFGASPCPDPEDDYADRAEWSNRI